MEIKGKPLDPIHSEADHFMVCPGCGKRFDMRDLGQVLEHVHGEDITMTETKKAAPSPKE